SGGSGVSLLVPCRASIVAAFGSVARILGGDFFSERACADFDLSQVEYVAPFLQRWGGTVLLYRWSAMKEQMRAYYTDRLQYPNVKVIDFSLSNLLDCILAETHRRVVFLLT